MFFGKYVDKTDDRRATNFVVPPNLLKIVYATGKPHVQNFSRALTTWFTLMIFTIFCTSITRRLRPIRASNTMRAVRAHVTAVCSAWKSNAPTSADHRAPSSHFSKIPGVGSFCSGSQCCTNTSRGFNSASLNIIINYGSIPPKNTRKSPGKVHW